MADSKDTKKLSSADFAAQKAQEAKERIASKNEESVEPVQLFLPGMDEFVRAMPNHIARSSLFAPVARGPKKMHDRAVLVTRGDAVITYTGHQLDEAQADAWMQLVHEAKDAALGSPVKINRLAFLKAMGRSNSGQNYQWLHKSMFAFTAATVVIEIKKDGVEKQKIGHTKAFHMLSDFEYDPDTETYTFTIDPRWKALFGNREYALIDWGKRLQIGRNQDMAKALQRLVATSSDQIQRFPLDWLKEKLQYAGRKRDFVDALEKAMGELERLNIIGGAKIGLNTKGKEQAVWTKCPTLDA